MRKKTLTKIQYKVIRVGLKTGKRLRSMLLLFNYKIKYNQKYHDLSNVSIQVIHQVTTICQVQAPVLLITVVTRVISVAPVAALFQQEVPIRILKIRTTQPNQERIVRRCLCL